MAARLKGWRFGVFVGGFVGSIATFMYFSAVQPLFMNSEHYKQVRSKVAPELQPSSKV